MATWRVYGFDLVALPTQIDRSNAIQTVTYGDLYKRGLKTGHLSYATSHFFLRFYILIAIWKINK